MYRAGFVTWARRGSIRGHREVMCPPSLERSPWRSEPLRGGGPRCAGAGLGPAGGYPLFDAGVVPGVVPVEMPDDGFDVVVVVGMVNVAAGVVAEAIRVGASGCVTR